MTSSRDATLPTRAITVSLLWLQCTIASSTPTVQSLRPVAHVRVGLFICLLFVVYLLNIFNFHWSFNLNFFLSLLTLIYSGARGGKRIQIYDHTSQFLFLNTFLSIAYFGWGGVINPVLCLCYAGINLSTAFRYGYDCYFLVVPLESMGESD